MSLWERRKQIFTQEEVMRAYTEVGANYYILHPTLSFVALAVYYSSIGSIDYDELRELRSYSEPGTTIIASDKAAEAISSITGKNIKIGETFFRGIVNYKGSVFANFSNPGFKTDFSLPLSSRDRLVSYIEYIPPEHLRSTIFWK